jgi:hypothetical protein
MKNLMLVIFCFLLVSAGCAKSIRYSHEEIRGYSTEIREHIRKGEIAVGMTKLQVRYAWGGPDVIVVLKPDAEGKERTEWVYKKFFFLKTSLIFTDDRLTGIISNQPSFAK